MVLVGPLQWNSYLDPHACPGLSFMFTSKHLFVSTQSLSCPASCYYSVYVFDSVRPAAIPIIRDSSLI